MIWLMLSLSLAEEPWLNSWGAGGMEWGSTNIPTDGVPRRRDFLLPDAGFLSSVDPVDLELPAPAGEKRIVRYALGALVDAWWVSPTPIDAGALVGYVKPEWTGIVLGPEEAGFAAIGLASSWNLGGRTLFHWRDRMGKYDILASRAVPPPEYGISRAVPIPVPPDSGSRADITGSLRKLVVGEKGRLATCLDQSRMPVRVVVQLRMDKQGLPARIKVEADQPTMNLEECITGSIAHLRGEAGGEGTFELARFR
jgi:hypothetical protein